MNKVDGEPLGPIRPDAILDRDYNVISPKQHTVEVNGVDTTINRLPRSKTVLVGSAVLVASGVGIYATESKVVGAVFVGIALGLARGSTTLVQTLIKVVWKSATIKPIT